MKVFNHKRFRNSIRMSSCFFKNHKKSLPPVSSKKKPLCEQLRAQLAKASPIDLPDGTQFVFMNQLSGYNPSICTNGTIPTVEQLKIISEGLKVDGHPLCPMIVWATKDGIPTLVQVNPNFPKYIKVKQKPSLTELAYTICVRKPQPSERIVLQPGEEYQITSSNPTVLNIRYYYEMEPGCTHFVRVLSNGAEVEYVLVSIASGTIIHNLNGAYDPSTLTLENRSYCPIYLENITAY